MKKNELILSAVAAVVMTGCGGGSSSDGEVSTTTTASVPSYTTQEAEINSPAAVESTVNTLSALESLGAVPTSATKSIKHGSMKDKVLTATVDKHFKSVSELRAQKAKSKIKSVMALAGCEPYTETVAETCISGSASLTIDIREGTNPGECISTYSFTANSCTYEDEWIDTNTGDTYVWSGTENGNDTGTYVEIIDANGWYNMVSASWDSAYTWKGTDTYTSGADGTTITYAGTEKVDEIYTWKDNYTLTEAGVFSYDGTSSITEKGTVAITWSVNGTNELTLAYKTDMSQSMDDSQANKFAFVMDGFVDMTYTLGALEEQRFSFAAEALNSTYDFSTSGVIKSTTDGKIGSQCTGGMVGFATDRIITNDYSDAYELPNDGLMTLTGAAGSTATLEYQEDTTGTRAVATVGETTKTYTTYTELYGEACQGEFLNPMGGEGVALSK